MRADHIYVHRLGGLYEHHGIDCGNGEVIHYARRNRFEPNIVAKTSLDDFTRGDQLLIREYDEFEHELAHAGDWIENSASRLNRVVDRAMGIAIADAAATADFSEGAVMQRAESRLGDVRFDLAFHNCEHFATWCKTGISSSRQITAIWKVALSGVEFYRRRLTSLVRLR